VSLKRSRGLLGCAVVACLVAGVLGWARAEAPRPNDAAGASPEPGFWSILVKPNAKWILKDTTSKAKDKDRDKVVVETHDVRTVGSARVARLTWTHVTRDDRSPLDQCGFGCPRRVAVTSAGVYFLDEDASDAQILKRVQRSPDRSEPPRPYKGTKKNQGRYLTFDGARACIGEGPIPGEASDCEDTCFAEVCVSAKDGVVELSGTWAPDYGIFAQDGVEAAAK